MNASEHTGVFHIEVPVASPKRKELPPLISATEPNHPKNAGCADGITNHCSSRFSKRCYDIVFSFCGLLLLAPFLIMIALLVKLSDGGCILYRQKRTGRFGRDFDIIKFRTMIATADQLGPSVTKRGDRRITWIGRILRKSKLDELPQLLNVLKGEMSLVGPRPEVPRYVQYYTLEQRSILNYRPGITDLATLCFRDEETLLANAGNVEDFYISQCIPRKIRLNLEYARRANIISDTLVILQTVFPYWLGVLICYACILSTSLWLASGLVNNFAIPSQSNDTFLRGLELILPLQLFCLAMRRQYNDLLSYFSFREGRQLAVTLGLSALILLGCQEMTADVLPTNIILIDALISCSLLCSFRLLLFEWREQHAPEKLRTSKQQPARIGIIGAGKMGAQLAAELIANRGFGRLVVAFFDDDFHKWQKRIHDIPVAGMPECLLDGWSDKLDEVVIAVSDAPRERVHEIEVLLQKTSLKFYTVSNPARFWDTQTS